MNFEVDRYSSAWAHIALCADLTWATEPPDEYIVANQRLWTQHCRVSQVLQNATGIDSQTHSNNQIAHSSDSIQNNSEDKHIVNNKRSVKDTIPESRLAQYYGNFYYDELRERCYTDPNEKINTHGCNGQCSGNSDVTECWMLPEVDYWYRKLLEDPQDKCSSYPRRRRHFRMLPDEDLSAKVLVSAASTSPGASAGAGAGAGAGGGAVSDAEAALAARLQGVRALWAPRQDAPRKMRARRRARRSPPALAPPYCLDTPAPLLCDPRRKFQFDSPRLPQLPECQRGVKNLTASVHAAMRATTARCPPYRGSNTNRYSGSAQRPARYPERRCGIWWPREHASPRNTKARLKTDDAADKRVDKQDSSEELTDNENESQTKDGQEALAETKRSPKNESPAKDETKDVVHDDESPSTSAAAMEAARNKRLYSTVLSTSPQSAINVNIQKLVSPGLLKLNPKIGLPAARLRSVDNKFEELEKEALEQYKASDESIDTKFQELEKQAVEQYSTSNSNTSCSSGNSADKKPTAPANQGDKSPKFPKEQPVDSVVIYSQNFPEQNATRAQPSANALSNTLLKNLHTPQRGEKKENHRKSFRGKGENRAASDTDYEAREPSGAKAKSPRWAPPKKRHLALCASDGSSDDDVEEGGMKDAAPRLKTRAPGQVKSRAPGQVKMSAHGGGDLQPIARKA